MRVKLSLSLMSIAFVLHSCHESPIVISCCGCSKECVLRLIEYVGVMQYVNVTKYVDKSQNVENEVCGSSHDEM